MVQISTMYDFLRQLAISDATNCLWRRLERLFLAKNGGGLVMKGKQYPFLMTLRTKDEAHRVFSQYKK